MFGIPVPFLVPLVIFVAILLVSGMSYIVNLNNDLAKARENEILNREIMRKQEADELAASQKTTKQQLESAYDRELVLLMEHKRFADALDYIDERRRLAFEQGNTAREDMYMRYRSEIERMLAEGPGQEA